MSLPTAGSLGLGGIFAGNYTAAKEITEETISQINALKGYAQSQATQIEDAVESLLASSQVDLPQIPNFGTAISLQGALATLPAPPAQPTIDTLPAEFSVPDFEPSVDGVVDTSDAPVFTASTPAINCPRSE